MACHIEYLPDEILEHILNLIPPYKDLKECMLVCKRWYHAVKHVIEHRESYFQRSVAYGSLLWDALPTDERLPSISKRHSHSACAYENSMYIFGGCTKTGTTFNDLWKLDLDTRKWERPIPMGNYPSPKACASMVYYKKSFILFGGWAHPPSYPLFEVRKLFSELHIYSITANKWTAIETLNSPPATCAHSASVHDNIMVVFGGISDFLRSSNNIWCFNLDTHSWYQQSTPDPKPQPRYGHSQIPLNDKNLLILGGCTAPNVGIDDVWLLNMSNPDWTWTKIKISGNEWAPMMIWCHPACKVGDNIIILSKRKTKNQNKERSTSERVMCYGPVAFVDNCKQPEVKRNIPVEQHNVPENRQRHLPPGSSTDRHRPRQRVRIVVERNNWNGPMAAFHPDHGVNRIGLNRLKLLDDIYKINEEYRRRNERKKIVNGLSIFVLNIANVLCEDRIATWVKQSKCAQKGPEERILYSFILGKGELIFFGGMKRVLVTNGHTESDSSEVFNDVHFLNPPRYTI
ncbi:F-box only protein 42 [Chelonus insularis]|uniref:F-box only protein 42 n=1 Tax=Chelonus insularis TaxID=460826 RepID=UPI00158DAB7B|nr:F-box only protein 42 [Chelonus insularis]